ncbi:hypothetical protein KC19_5G071500 [Ceratodon purpureus]|uniref:Secreted protein n=1 Tax=Ceratodon purpureus TaxID=3225 RepID=A0A8T0I115_CERPU|nr:hypothetical protein KC19_5G071500 [Ceratodon purpureus]
MMPIPLLVVVGLTSGSGRAGGAEVKLRLCCTCVGGGCRGRKLTTDLRVARPTASVGLSGDKEVIERCKEEKSKPAGLRRRVDSNRKCVKVLDPATRLLCERVS